MIFNQPGGSYNNAATIADGATIAAAGFSLTNGDSGRIYGGVTFATGGSTFTNLTGGVVRLSQFEDTQNSLIFGSDGVDTVINGGIVGGRISLAAGADIFIDRGGSFAGVDLGSGDDTYRAENSQAGPQGLVDGGDGTDDLIFAAAFNFYGHFTGFERLTIMDGGFFEGFSGYQSITFGPFTNRASYSNFIDSLNPAADLTLAGQSIALSHSAFHSISGGNTSDYVTLGMGNAVPGGISLGGGDEQQLRFRHAHASNTD